MKAIAERLKTLRENLGVSQSKLAEEIGTTQASVNRYENGKVTPPAETLLWYADRFDVSLDYIFGRTELPQGKLYKYRPIHNVNSSEIKKFVEMCFDPKSPMNERLKQTLLEMFNDEKARQ